ncbi:hypothetical protein Tco_0804206 [Tanacetum coccineum]|uniref:Uncharacterized protein n=1 Tax=Tanacetum coccineum TaxID=301880 RepID=A0ABQ5A811_9ASTR
MDVKSASLWKIDEEGYMCLIPPGFLVPKYSSKVYKVVMLIYGLHKTPPDLVCACSRLQVTQRPSHLVMSNEFLDSGTMLEAILDRNPQHENYVAATSDYGQVFMDSKSTVQTLVLNFYEYKRSH